MATSPLPSVFVALGQNASAEPDAELLSRYVSTQDDAAFALLVQRYARLVWRVARTRCRSESTAEDVFQATFVVLARKAGSIRIGGSLPGWLHRTAHRIAVKATRGERPTVQLPTNTAVSADPLDALSARELLSAIDDEMAKLSDAERSVLVLCGVANQSLDETAARLGWSIGSVKGRLERARAKLRIRLDARGLTLPAVVIGLINSPPARAVEAAVTLPGGPVPPSIEQLISGGSHMTRRFIALGLLAVLVVSGVGAGFGLIPRSGPATASAAPVPKELKQEIEAWGEEIDGLQAGLRMPNGTTIEPGKSGELQVVVRNVSKKQIEIAYIVKQAGVWVSSEVNQDNDIRLSWGCAFNGKPQPVTTTTLEPGEEFVRWRVRLRHIPAADTKPDPDVSDLDLPTGNYTVVMPQIGVDVANTFRTPNPPAFHDLDTGTLTVRLPEARKVNHRAPVPKDKSSPVIWSEPLRVDWIESGAVRLAGVWAPDSKSVFTPSPAPDAEDEKLDFGGVDIRDADTGKLTKKLVFPAWKDGRSFLSQSLAVSGDGKTVYASGSVFAPRGKGEAARGIVTWKMDKPEEKPTVTTSADPCEAPIALSPDGKQLATVTNGGSVGTTDTARGLPLWVSNLAIGRATQLTALVFHPTDGTLLIGTNKGGWLVCDATTGKKLATSTALGVNTRAVAVSSDGQASAAGGTATTAGVPLVIMISGTARDITDAVPEKEAINGLAYSPDGKHLVAACSDGMVRVFDAATGKLATAPKEHKGAVFSVAFSPDGKRLLTVGRDAIKVWDVESLLKAK